MKLIKADVHLHTCLSPCAEIIQSPRRVVEKANEKGFNLIFITDHNSMANAEAAIKSAKNFPGLKVYPGMEITTKEEVHVLSLFENISDAYGMQTRIDDFLPDAYYEKEREEQIIANEADEVEGYYGKSLFSAVNLGLDEIIGIVHKYNGIAIAAHIDRPSFSILSQLGFIPDDCNLDALEVSPNMGFDEAGKKYPEYYSKFRFVKGSDSHSPETFGETYTEFYGEKNDFESFLKYIKE